MISANDVFNDLRKSGKLPSPGGVAMRLIDLASRDDVTAGELSRALQGDPSLAGRVLKVANSASAGSRAVVSIADAVVRIGFRSVRQLAMGFSLIDRCGTGVCENFNYDRFWSRALAAAVAAERLGREVRTIPADECFTLGLMHDVGTLALATAYPIEYSGMLADLATRTAEERMARERDAFGLGNRDITALLLADWHLPKPLIEAVVDRGTVAAGRSDRAQRLADLVQLATIMGDACVDSAAAGPSPAETFAAGFEGLGLDREQVEVILADVLAAWHDWGADLNVETRNIAVADLLALQNEAAAPTAEPARGAVAGDAIAVGNGVATPAPESRLRVLIAEDVESQRLTLTRLLMSMGFEVESAVDGIEALAMLGARRADILVTDLLMPGLDGIGLCRAMRSTPAGAMTYAIVLTASDDQGKLVEAFDAGADDYISKPIVRREFEARLRGARRVVALQHQLEREAERLREANTRLEAVNRQIASVALTDSLTRLPNRRHLLERFKQDWAAAARLRRDFSVIFVDIDHFKKVNDVRGHDAGDIVLERVARVLRRAVRTEDTVGRFGGEEFVVLCPGCALADAKRIADRIRGNIETEEFSIGGERWHVTASFGVAATQADAPTGWENLLRSADLALYKAKHQGRNRVVAEQATARVG